MYILDIIHYILIYWNNNVRFDKIINNYTYGKVEIMLKWKTPDINDGDLIRKIVADSGIIGSDLSFANIYLFRDKYKTKICAFDGFFIRHYSFGESGKYGFPVGNGDIEKAVLAIEQDASERNESLSFVCLTEEQKEILENIRPEMFQFTSDDGTSDYIYSSHELANLSGRAFHKKKNHFHRFTRLCPDAVFKRITDDNIEDAWAVEEIWYKEHTQNGETDYDVERAAIREALDNFSGLKLWGGIIYVDNKPCAMAVASLFNDEASDIHYEKVTNQCADNGGYAAINKFIAEGLEKDGVLWLNREEDMGIEGLRKAKLSYRPKMMFKRYEAIIKG